MVEPFTVIHPLAGWVESGGWLAIYQGSNGPYQHVGRDGVLDFGGTAGAPVLACAAGTARVNHSGDGWGNGSFGSCVRLDHPQGDGRKWSIVAHLEQFSITVEDGEFVQQGQMVGRVGLTGLTDGYHTHWAIMNGGGGGFDPMRYLSDGVWKLGNPDILDPYQFLAPAVGPPAPVPTTEALLLQAIARIVTLEAIIARMDNQAIVLGPDGQGYSPLESVRRLNAVVKGHVENHPGSGGAVPHHLHYGTPTGDVIEADG